MGDVFHYLELRAQGRIKEHRFRKSWKAVLYMLEDAAAIPSHNQPCEFSGEPRATFLMDFSLSKLRVASTHGDHTVRVSDVRTGKCTHILTGHPRTPWCLAFSPTSDDILASGCLAGEIRIWDLMGGGSEVLRNPRHGQVVTSLAFHPSGQVLAFATMNFIYFWDWSKEAPFAFTHTSHESERIRWLKFDPYGHYLYTGIGNLTSFYRDIILAEMEASGGLDDNASTEERRNQQTLNRARYQRLLERFTSFQRDRHRYRNDGFFHRRDEYNPSINSNRAGQRAHTSTAETDDQPSLLGNSSSQSFPSQAMESETAFSWDDSRPGRRSLDSVRLGELPTRQRWGRYEPSFFSRSNDSSSASSTDSSRYYNLGNNSENRSSTSYHDSAASRLGVNSWQDGQSSGPYPRTNLFPTRFEESPGMPSSLSYLSSRLASRVDSAATSRIDNIAALRMDIVAASRADNVAISRRDNVASSHMDNVAASRMENVVESRRDNVSASRLDNVAASDGLYADEFKILPVDQGIKSRCGSARIPPEPSACGSSGRRPLFLQQQDKLRSLLNRYLHQSGEGPSAASALASSCTPSLTTQSFIPSAASTAECLEANARPFSVPPLAEAAQASVQQSRGMHLYTAASCSSNDHIQADSQGSFETPSAVCTSTSENVFCREEQDIPTTADISVDVNLSSANNHLSSVMPDGSEQINPGLKKKPLKACIRDYTAVAGCSRGVSTSDQNHSRHTSRLASSEAAPSAAVIPEGSSSSFVRQHRTSLKMTAKPKHNNSLSGRYDTFSWINRHGSNNLIKRRPEVPHRNPRPLFLDPHSLSQESTSRPVENNTLGNNKAAPSRTVPADQSSASVRLCDFSSRTAQSKYSRYNEGTAGCTDSSSYSSSLRRISDIRPRCTNPLLNNFEATSVYKPEYNFPHLRPTSSLRRDNQEQNSSLGRSADSAVNRLRRLGVSQGAERVQEPESASLENPDTSFRRTLRLGHRYPFLRHETVSRTQSSMTQVGIQSPFIPGQSQTLRSPRLTYRNHPLGPYEGLEFRHHLSTFNDRQIPRPVTDQTSQTLGAMNLPASYDQGTDVVGLDDTAASLIHAGTIIESPHASLAPCIGFSDDADQNCAFPNDRHDGTSIILSNFLDRDRADASAGDVSRSLLESERFHRIQNIVRNVQAYLTEEYGESFLERGVRNRNTELRNVADSPANTVSGVGERNRVGRFQGRNLRSEHSSSTVNRSIPEQTMEDEMYEPEEQAASHGTTIPWSPDISLSSTLSPPTFMNANSSQISPFSDTSALHVIASHVNRAPSAYSSDPVFSIPTSSASRATQLSSSAGPGPPETGRFSITSNSPSLLSDSSNRPSLLSDSSYRPSLLSDSSNRPSLLSDSSYRPLLSGAEHNSPRFHPYASALRRRNSFQHRQQATRDSVSNYPPVSDTAARRSEIMSAGSSDSSEGDQHQSSAEPPSQCVASRLRHLSDSDQPSAFSIFSNANREAERHPSQFRVSGLSLFNSSATANSGSASSSTIPSGLQSSPQSRSQTLAATDSGPDPTPDSETEHLQESSGATGEVQQASDDNVTWRTPHLSLVNQVAVTEYLERRVIELDRRLSDLEQNYNSRLRELQLEFQLRRTAHLAPGAHPTRLRGTSAAPVQDSRESMPRSEVFEQASSGEGTQPVPFRQLLECLRRQNPNPQPRVSEADLPTSVTISQARDNDSGEDTSEAGSSLRRRWPWHSLRQIHLHADYSNTNILDDTINHRNVLDGSNIGGPYSNPQYDLGMVSNMVVQTHRIQQWDITKITVPNISDATENLVVRHCKLHNDASCNLSQDGTLLVTIVPSHRRTSDINIVALFSLRRQSFAQCLFTKSFGPDALSVSISPLNRYVLVGLATRRTIFVTSAQMVGQVFRLVKEKAGESSMAHHKDIYHIYDEDRGSHVSMNSARWLPGVGEGLVYGTNRGDLHFFRAGSRKVYDREASCDTEEYAASRRRATARNSIGTQTTTVSIRRSASTQTLDNEQGTGERMNTELEAGISDGS